MQRRHLPQGAGLTGLHALAGTHTASAPAAARPGTASAAWAAEAALAPAGAGRAEGGARLPTHAGGVVVARPQGQA